jgi:hypothetical protein
MKRILLLTVVSFFGISSMAQTRHTISGYIKDASDGEALIGATVFIASANTGTTANAYGFYSITLPAAEYKLVFSFVGYERIEKDIKLDQDIQLDIELKESMTELQEIVVDAKGDPLTKIQSTEMSTAELDIKTIRKIPAFLGEVDVIKAIQSLPGISTVGEGASGYNSRGGNVGQNLILLDEAPVYNSSHMLGFFSVFNPDAVIDTKLYKGAIPAKYGGRLSSILDVRMKEGNSKKFETTGGIGTIFSRLALESPFDKGKGSFIVAARRSYIDVLARPFVQVLKDGGALNFYDLTAKVNYKFGEKDRVYLSGYFGRDNFLFSKNQGFSWGNQTATIRWNHLFNKRLFANFTGVYSEYSYDLQFGKDDLNRFKWNSSITNYIFKPEFSYFINSNNELSFGGEAIYYYFVPANSSGTTNGEVVDISLPKKYNLETSLYISNNQRIGSRVSLEYGLRFSHFDYFGPGTAYTYNDTVPGIRRTVKSEKTYTSGQSIAQYNNWEPRFSAKYQLTSNSSVKASYNRMVQYLHLISNTTASNPLDVWTPSSNNILPEIGDQYALGYFRTFKNNTWEASVESYWRSTQNQIDYINGADLLINKYIEGDLLTGKGRAYGMEFYLHKRTGRLNGWISYTLAKTELQTNGINNGDWYPTRFDQRHNLKIAAFYEINQRWSFSANFVYLSGTPANFPTSRYIEQGILIPYDPTNSRNNVRVPAYHRLDISFRLEGKKTTKSGKPRKNHDYWVFSIYNVYARQNPFSIYFQQNDQRVAPTQAIQSQAKQVSIIGSLVPSFSYNFNF